jgi:hypothetical protein
VQDLRRVPFDPKLTSLACAAVLLLVVSGGPTNAHYCSEPTKPYCLDLDFQSDGDFDNCRFEVESFVRSTSAYAQCLDDARNDAVRKANRAVEQFNCKARRESFCF